VIDIIRYDDDPKAALMREDWSRAFVRATSEAITFARAPGDDEDRPHRGAGRGDPEHAAAVAAAAGGDGASARARRADGERAELEDLLADETCNGAGSPISCAR
jgi:hypothetical protein